jgi:hypothetical protein
MTSLSRRLQRLEATTARIDPLGCARGFEEFNRSAREYIRSVCQYLGEPPDWQMPNSGQNQSQLPQLIKQVVTYRIRSLRHYSRQRNTYAECSEAT